MLSNYDGQTKWTIVSVVYATLTILAACVNDMADEEETSKAPPRATPGQYGFGGQTALRSSTHPADPRPTPAKTGLDAG